MEQKGEVYYIGLLNKFNQSTNYKDKLEIFDKEFGILKANYATPLVTNTENTIFISDFDILPEEDNKLQLKFFNELVFTKIEIILDNNKAWDTWGYNRFNEYVAKKIEDNQFSLFDLGLMTNSFNNRIKKTGATKILFIKKELKTIKDSVESFKTQDNFNLSALFEDLQKGNSINFSRYNFGLAYEQFIGIKIAENLSKYYSYLREQLDSLSFSNDEEERIKRIEKNCKRLSPKYIDLRQVSHLESALIKKYVISKERIKWKSSVSNLIFFLKKCEENNMVFFDENESEADLAYRCFYPHEISNGKINKEKDSYILKTLQSEKSKIVNKEIVPTFDISFEH